MNATIQKREISILCTPHKIRLMSVDKCPRCRRPHGAVGMQKSKSTKGLYYGVCPTNKKIIFVVA